LSVMLPRFVAMLRFARANGYSALFNHSVIVVAKHPPAPSTLTGHTH
jgi:hypothetical protein